MAVDVIQDTQKKGTTYRQQLTELMINFNKLVENGGDTSENFGKIMAHLLKSFEGVRINTESQVRKLQKEMATHEATLKSCNTFSNMLVGIITSYANEFAGKQTDNIYTRTVRSATVRDKAKGNGETKRVSDTDLLKTICKCGCVDEEDAGSCDCACHTDGFCDSPDCIYCMENKPVAKPKKKYPAKKVSKKSKKKSTKSK